MDTDQRIMERLDHIVKKLDKIEHEQQKINEKLSSVVQQQGTDGTKGKLEEIYSKLPELLQKNNTFSRKEKNLHKVKNPMLEDLWLQAMENIKKELTEVSFNTWIKPIKPLEIENEKIYLVIANDFAAGIIEARYVPLLQSAIRNVSGKDYEIEIFTEKKENSENNSVGKEFFKETVK